MSQLPIVWHHIEHETYWNIRTTGRTPRACTNVTETRFYHGTSRTGCARDAPQCPTLAVGIATLGQPGADAATAASALSLKPATVETIGADFVARRLGRRLCRRLLDLGACGAVDCTSIWYPVSLQRRMVPLAADGLELSKATTGIIST